MRSAHRARLIKAFIREINKGNDELAKHYLDKLRTLTAAKPGQIKIVIITFILDGTKGDVSSAGKSIENLQSIMPNLDITWVVRRDAEYDFAKLFCPTGVKMIEVTNEYSYLEKAWPFGRGLYHFRTHDHCAANESLAALAEANAIISTPTTIYFSRDNIRLIKLLEIPFISMTEYNFAFDGLLKFFTGASTLGDKFVKYDTGFGKSHYGVMLPKQSKHKTLTDLANNHIDPHVLQLLNPSKYRATHTLYFGYLNTSREDMVSSDSIVDDLHFAYACIRYQLFFSQEAKDIDIVINMKEATYCKLLNMIHKHLPKNALDKIKTISYIGTCSSNTNKNITTQVRDHTQFHPTGNICIRILQLFPLNPKTMQVMLNISEPLASLTGDQSFIEGIMAGKIVFYQAMFWKVKFFKAFIKLIADHLGTRSPLYQFYNHQLQSSYLPSSKTDAWKRIIKIYQQSPKLLQLQALEIAKHIKGNHDLSDNLYKLELKTLLENTIAVTEPPPISHDFARDNAENALSKAMADYIDEMRETSTLEGFAQSIKEHLNLSDDINLLENSKLKYKIKYYFDICLREAQLTAPQGLLSSLWFKLMHLANYILDTLKHYLGYELNLDQSNKLTEVISKSIAVDECSILVSMKRKACEHQTNLSPDPTKRIKHDTLNPDHQVPTHRYPSNDHTSSNRNSFFLIDHTPKEDRIAMEVETICLP